MARSVPMFPETKLNVDEGSGFSFVSVPDVRLCTMRYIVSGILLLALLLGFSALWMANHEWEGHEHEKSPVVRQTGIRPRNDGAQHPLPLHTIIEKLKLPKDTRILEIEREHRSSIMHYDIELVTAEGRIYKIHVDPFTARIVKREKEP